MWLLIVRSTPLLQTTLNVANGEFSFDYLYFVHVVLITFFPLPPPPKKNTREYRWFCAYRSFKLLLSVEVIKNKFACNDLATFVRRAVQPVFSILHVCGKCQKAEQNVFLEGVQRIFFLCAFLRTAQSAGHPFDVISGHLPQNRKRNHPYNSSYCDT